MSNSGVAIQSKHVAEHLVKSGKFQVFSISVALQHPDMRVGKTQEYGDDLIIIPATKYDDQNLIRQILDMEKPDALWIMTDPRFYAGLFAMADEVKKFCPIIWNCIWDNDPVPLYNKPIYDCIDFFGCINKVMFNVTQKMGYSDRSKYIPHGIKSDVFKILPDDQKSLRAKHLGAEDLKNVEFVLFYNSRNALRKRTGNVIMAYKTFLESLPPEEQNKVFLCMHTPPKDPEGQDLFRLIDDFGLKGKIGFSGNQIPSEALNEYYNMADVTIIQSSEEGFGLSCLESLMCGTPVIAGRTGGITDQLYDPDTNETFGILMPPDATSLVGSQSTPYIFSHHFNYEKTAQHIKDLYEAKKAMGSKAYRETFAGQRARESMLRRFNLENIVKTWEDVIVSCIEKHRENLESKTLSVVEC
jgi:glycosyltransferase involved in cell wall biosynthesis